MNRREGEVFAIKLCAEKHDVPAIIRLRAALKRLLRDYGLRCTQVVPTLAPTSDDHN
jgi:hypothetical protein